MFGLFSCIVSKVSQKMLAAKRMDKMTSGRSFEIKELRIHPYLQKICGPLTMASSNASGSFDLTDDALKLP